MAYRKHNILAWTVLVWTLIMSGIVIYDASIRPFGIIEFISFLIYTILVVWLAARSIQH